MKRISQVFFVFVITILAASRAANAFSEIQLILESATDGFSASHIGDLACVTEDAQPGMFSLVYRSSGGVLLTIAGHDFASSMSGSPAMSSNGDVSFQCAGPGLDGIYASSVSGGQVITIFGSSFGNERGAPSMSSSGGVAFLSTDGVYVCDSISSTPVLTIQGQNFARMGRPAVNTALDVCVPVSVDDGSGNPPVDTVFVQHSSGAFSGTIDFGNDFRLTSSQPKIIDNKKGLLVAGMTTGSSGTPEEVLMMCDFDDSNSVYFNPREISRYTDGVNFDELSICPDGSSYCGTRGGGSSLVWSPRSNVDLFGPESNGYDDPITLLSVGDPLAGSTITSLSITDGSMQLDGSVMFHASLANGFSGLFLGVVPEPTTLFSVMGLTSIALLRKRRAL